MNPILAETHSIIVYRNPIEQMLWESDAGSYLILAIVGAIVLLVVVGIFAEPINRMIHNRRRSLHR